MDEVTRRIGLARRAAGTLTEILAVPKTPVTRDAAIQRFEYSFEALWKATQRFLREREGLDTPTPAGTIRAAHSVGLLAEDDARLGLAMVADRNLTVHTYNEPLAEQIFGRLPLYERLFQTWLQALESRVRA